ncbi:hypothetical protein J6590_004061 [Homalodisca vitripennis]|nr:hypothetical protein J6590_004061 [Homalodisca vitripennis]
MCTNTHEGVLKGLTGRRWSRATSPTSPSSRVDVARDLDRMWPLSPTVLIPNILSLRKQCEGPFSVTKANIKFLTFLS